MCLNGPVKSQTSSQLRICSKTWKLLFVTGVYIIVTELKQIWEEEWAKKKKIRMQMYKSDKDRCDRLEVLWPSADWVVTLFYLNNFPPNIFCSSFLCVCVWNSGFKIIGTPTINSWCKCCSCILFLADFQLVIFWKFGKLVIFISVISAVQLNNHLLDLCW